MSTLWLWLCALLQISWTLPTFLGRPSGHIPMHGKLDRAPHTNNFIKKQKAENQNRERIEKIIGILAPDRWSKGQDTLKYHRSQCNYMNESWIHWHYSANQELKSVYTFKISTGQLKATFPQRNLFQYVSRVYRCCKLRLNCPKIKGLQGTIENGTEKKEISLYIDADNFGLSIRRAELHLEVFANEQLTVIPVLTINGQTHSRFAQMRSGHIIDLMLDVMFLLQALKEKEMDSMVNETVIELSLTLHCMENELFVPCNSHRVFLLNAPFIALQY